MSTRTEEKLPQRFRLMNRNLITIILVNGEKILLPYTKSSYLSETFDEVCRMVGVFDKDLFGFAQEIDGFYHYLNLSNKLSKINFKSTRKKLFTTSKKPRPIDSNISSATDISQVNAQGPILFFRVKFFVRAHTLRDRHTKHQYYEQLRYNYLNYPFSITDEQALSLASLILQADYGPYHPGRHKDAYFVLDRCMPTWCLKRFDQSYLRRHLPALHSTHGRMTQAEAEFRFVRVVDAQPNHYNMHLVAAMDRTTSPTGEPIWLGISPIGLELYAKRSDGLLVHMSTLVWQQINKITYKKRLVVVQVGKNSSRELRLDAQSSSVAEHLFWLCRQMHLYQITAQMRAPRSVDALDAQLAVKNGYRESYVYSDQADLQKHGSGRGSYASRPSSVIQLLSSPDSSITATNTFPRVPKRKPDPGKFGTPEPKQRETRPTSHKSNGEKRVRKEPRNAALPSIHVSTPNLTTSGYMETDIDSFLPSPASPHPPPLSSLPSDQLVPAPLAFSALKQRALSCDGSTPFLHPEVRRLQENRALSSSLPLLTQLCRDPDLVHLLGVHDDPTADSPPPFNNNKQNGVPTAGMKSWKSEVLHLDRLTFDNDEEEGNSMLVRDPSDVSAFSFHFRDNDYINLRPKQLLNSLA